MKRKKKEKEKEKKRTKHFHQQVDNHFKSYYMSGYSGM